MAKKSVNDLPEEMVTKILSRLAVKSLLRCKSVCKTWLSIISNPHTVKCHLHRAIKNPSVLIIKEYHQLEQQREGTLTTLDMSPIHVDSLVMPRMFFAFPVVGSCNGILCLEHMSRNVVYLWNPSIRQYKGIRAPLRCKFRYKMGFGYDSISDDYKVLCIVYENWTAVIPHVFVYSTNADRWRRFQDPILKNVDIYEEINVVVKCVLYFHSTKGLIYFDLHKEVFGLVSFPSFVQRQMSNILDFEGSVAVVYESMGNGSEFDVWTLDDASNQVSWTKKSSVDPWTLDLECSIWLHCSLGAGKFYGVTLVNGADQFLQYVFCDYEKRESKCYGLREEDVHATVKYTETLVSLYGFQQVE